MTPSNLPRYGKFEVIADSKSNSIIACRWQLWRRQEYLDKVFVLVNGCVLVVSIPSALGAQL